MGYAPAASMSERAFYDDRARAEAKAAVQAIEAQTSAEVVVALRHASAKYHEADYLFGFLVSLAVLVTMLFVDREFMLGSFPVGVALGFAIGAAVAAYVPPLRRAFVPPPRRRAAVRTAARAAFVDLGVSHTHRRTGILVFVSMFERRVEVVADVGVDPHALGPEWTQAVLALERSLLPSPSLDRFLERMRALGPLLAHVLPHHEGDANELPDEVQAG
jgi:putative membrane protein